jgi:type II secretory pathway component PulF
MRQRFRVSWVAKVAPWWFPLSRYAGWRIRWIGTHNQQKLSGVCAKKSFIECYIEIVEQKIDHVTLVPDNQLMRIRHGITQHHILADRFFAHLPDLLHTNPCMVTAIKQIYTTQTQPDFCATLLQLIHAITAGKTLSQALESHPDYFTALDVRCIQMGEAYGDIIPALGTIMQHRTLQRHLARTIQNSCRYPLFLLGFALLTMGFFLIEIIPQFSQVLSQVDMNIPRYTQHLIQLAQWLTESYTRIGCAIGLSIGVYYTLPYSTWQNRHHPLYAWLPTSLKQLEWQFRFCHTLALFIHRHMELTQGIQCLMRLSTNPQEQKQLAVLSAAIHHGMGFSAACSHSRILPSALIQQLAVAERSHTLATTLQSIATELERQGKTQLSKYTDLLAPGIILSVGILIGCMLYCLYLPMLEAPLAL